MHVMKSKRAVIFIILLLSIFFAALSFGIYASGDSAAYVNPDEQMLEELKSSDIVQKYLSEAESALSAGEREFLDKFATLKLTYSDIITTDKVVLSYDDESGILNVKAEEYSYTGQGKALVWIPLRASVGGKEVTLIGGEGCISVEKNNLSDGCTVTYEAAVSFGADDISGVVNLYHDTAKYIKDVLDYNEKNALYNEYLKARRLYDDAKAKYEKYIREYNEYLLDLSAYEKYEEDMKTYESEYKIYMDNLAVYDAYEAELEKYSKYLSDMELVKKHLAVVELVKVEMTDGRSLYAAVNGDTVDKVLENESLLTGTLDADPAVINMAGDATERVRALMKGYYGCKTEEEKYNYYIINYENFCDSFLELTQSLDKLYRYRKVRGTLIAEGKDKKYVILVAQLALVSNALIDGELYDYDGNIAYTDKWTIEGQTVEQILKKKYHTDANDSSPLDGGYPEAVVKPTAPEGVIKPTLPLKPKTPIMPEPVNAPGAAPEAVDAPVLPTAATESARIAYEAMSEDEKAMLLEEVRKGNVIERDKVTSEFVLKLTSSVKRHLDKEEFKVEFLSENGDELFSLYVEAGSAAVFNGEIPQKSDDEFYSYLFGGWMRSDGERVSLLSVNSDLRLYPFFLRAAKTYEVCWIIDGKEYKKNVTADTMPVCPVVPQKSDEGGFLYEFVGWDKPVSHVNSDTSYTAIFNKRHIVSYNGTGAALTDEDGTVVCNAKNFYALDTAPIDISDLLSRIAGRRALLIETFRGSIYFSYTDVLKMKDSGVSALQLDVSQAGIYKNTFSVNAFDSSGEKVSEDIHAELTVSFNVNDIASCKLKGELDEAVNFSYSNGKISFALRVSCKYILAPVYEINVYTSNGVRVIVSNSHYNPGDSVTFALEVDDGYEISGISVIDVKTGKSLELSDNAFRMPEGDVEIEVSAKLKKYTVIFISGGKVISKREYEHGATVNVPKDPQKESDKHYSYVFSGWSPKLSETVTDSVTYVSRYKTQRIPVASGGDELKLSDSIMNLLKIFTALMALICAAPCILLSCLFVLRYKRLFAKRKKD